MLVVTIVLAVLCLSLAVMTLQLHFKLKSQYKKPVHSVTAEEILHDLTEYGATLIKVERIDPTQILLRRN